MLNNLSLRKKILLLIGGTISVLLIIASSFFVSHIADTIITHRYNYYRQ